MHLLTILAFAFIFWRAEADSRWVIVGEHDLYWTLACVLAQPVLIGIAAILSAGHGIRLLDRQPEQPETAQQFHHRATLILRTITLIAFAVTVFLTRWAEWFNFARVTPALQIVGDLIVLTPFVVTLIAQWVAVYPLERALRGHDAPRPGHESREQLLTWSRRSYLDFHIRHYVLVVAVPMTLILFAADMIRGYETQLKEWARWEWTPDVLLAAVAAGVFVAAPVMLRYIWRTASLEPGPLRQRLEALCKRIGLRCREILIWNSDGIMINAAVMGVMPAVRYVLLSDALLATMSVEQIEAVFGHEAGHVRYRHIQHFLVFAFVGWVLVAGIMELLALVAISLGTPPELSATTIHGIGLVATVVYWGFGFGWLSRRFERQADAFGASCVTPTGRECRLPCSVHLDDGTTCDTQGRVCATGAALFTSALDRVAVLNGIPHEERSWRHSSIGSRIRFLTSLADDPCRAGAFNRLIRRVKTTLLVLAAIGLIVTICYWILTPEPAILRLNSGGNGLDVV